MNPVPSIVTVVPPLVEPDVGERDVIAGTTGFHCQLIWVMLTPQEPFSVGIREGRLLQGSAGTGSGSVTERRPLRDSRRRPRWPEAGAGRRSPLAFALLALVVLQAEYVKTRVLALYGCHTMEQ